MSYLQNRSLMPLELNRPTTMPVSPGMIPQLRPPAMTQPIRQGYQPGFMNIPINRTMIRGFQDPRLRRFMRGLMHQQQMQPRLGGLGDFQPPGTYRDPSGPLLPWRMM